MSFFAELKRRNVFRAGIAYAITGWLIAQIAGLAADSFGAPDWVMKMIITILLLGFPIAMVMAWAYEMTPEGLRRDGGGESSYAENTTKLDRTIIIALVAALAYFAYDKFVLDPTRDAAMLESAVMQVQDDSEPPAVPEPEIAQKQSIAVLPFVNMSKDKDNEYFSDGLSEELLNMLVKIPELRVAARTSSFSFKDKDSTVAEIASALNVTHVLEGSVRKSGNQVRITAQLIKADDGFHLWSENFDRTLNDIFVVQDEIASKVAKALEVTLLGKSRAERGINPEAHLLYLKGLHFLTQRGGENAQKSLPYVLEAIEKYPTYAEAWATLPSIYYELVNNARMTREEGVPLILNSLQKAHEIDPDSALTWGIDGFIGKNVFWEWKEAQAKLTRAHELEPNNNLILGWTASLAGTLGELDKSVELYEKAFESDPLSLSRHSALGLMYNKVHRYDDALEIFMKQAQLSPYYHWAYFNIGRTYLYKNEPELALQAILKNPDNVYKALGLAMAYSSLKLEAEARTAMETLVSQYGPDSASLVAAALSWRGEIDQAFEWLQIAYERRETVFAYILGDNIYYSLLDDPRWAELLKKVNLYDYWLEMPAEYGGPQP